MRLAAALSFPHSQAPAQNGCRGGPRGPRPRVPRPWRRFQPLRGASPPPPSQSAPAAGSGAVAVPRLPFAAGFGQVPLVAGEGSAKVYTYGACATSYIYAGTEHLAARADTKWVRADNQIPTPTRLSRDVSLTLESQVGRHEGPVSRHPGGYCGLE